MLTEHRFLRENLTDDAIREFYATGERDLARFLSLVETVRGSAFLPSTALDFGCGLGRITIPLARRCRRVVGVDVAPSMLEEAAKAASSQLLPNVAFLPVAELDLLVPETFDFVVSHIVFQHIPPADAEAYVKRLLALVAPGGAAVLHFSLRRTGGPVRRWLRVLRSRSRLVHRISCLLRRERPLPYMQMNEYDRSRVEALFVNADFAAPTVVETDHGGIVGGLFISTRRTAA
ncbi:MAG: class I SAM-dependent methyltransferase [Thermoanaerobaculia bacterium]|nr:class I SAM-dependent methyltransferase [Thermoanaerobaculia bacterium]